MVAAVVLVSSICLGNMLCGRIHLPRSPSVSSSIPQPLEVFDQRRGCLGRHRGTAIRMFALASCRAHPSLGERSEYCERRVRPAAGRSGNKRRMCRASRAASPYSSKTSSLASFRKVHQFGHGRLHAVSHFVLLDAGEDFSGSANRWCCCWLSAANASSCARRSSRADAGRIAEVQHRIALAAHQHPLVVR